MASPGLSVEEFISTFVTYKYIRLRHPQWQGPARHDIASARHVIGCHLTQETRVQIACRRGGQ
jgi:hypothetical protein